MEGNQSSPRPAAMVAHLLPVGAKKHQPSP